MKIIKFWAERCWPCKAIAPILREIAEEEWIEFIEYDVDNDYDKTNEYNITSVPTVIIVGKEITKFIWPKSKEEVKKLIELVK